MAFDRTGRFVKPAAPTLARLGPGSYDVSDLSKPLRDPDNAYPFLSGTGRQTLGIPKDAHKLPGPGSYNIQGGVSITYTDARFKGETREGPGPTEYALPDDLFKETPLRTRSHRDTWHGPAGKLWLIRPPRSIVTTGLSVPSKRDVGGYDFDERGVLVKNPIIEQEPIDFYDIPRKETNFTTLRYKGNFWSRMKGRDDGRTSVTPGPGHYEHETKKSPAQIRDERVREAKRAVAKQPRFLEALYRQKLRQNFPAPDHYDPPRSAFDKYKRIPRKCNVRTPEPPPFDQSAKRFDESFKSDAPGPGVYEIATRQICHSSILRAPFGVFSARFKKIVDAAPGPADYHTDAGNLAFESEKRFKDKHVKMISYPDFHETSVSTSDDDDEYKSIDGCKKVNEGKCAVYHAVFKSTVDRFPRIHKDADRPDPGAYEALSVFKVNRDRCDFLCQRLAPPFGSRAGRLPTIPRGVDFRVPGPSRYDLRGDISKNVKGGVICYAPRERKDVEEGPCPFRYHIHPYIGSSVLKKSFNVTLGKSKILKDADKIQNPWHHRRSRKVLRCFAVPRKEYQHCTPA